MASVTDTAATIQSRVVETLETVQGPALDAVRKAVETVGSFVPADRPAVLGQLPTPVEIVDTAFGYAKEVLESQNNFASAILDNQHKFAKAVAEAVTPLLATPAAPAKPKAAKPAAAAA